MNPESTISMREQIREHLAAQRRGYILAEMLEYKKWTPPTTDEKLSFDRLMQDTTRRRLVVNPCTMMEWYRALMRSRDE